MEPTQKGGGQRVRNALTYFAAVAIFGGVVPYEKGLGFFDPVLLAAYACIGIVFAGPAAAHAFETPPESLNQALHWIVKAALVGELVAIVMLGCGIGTVYATSRGYVFPPDVELVVWAIGLGTAGALAMASLAAWVTVELSPGAARMTLRGVFLILLALFYFDGRRLPDVIQKGTLGCLLATAVLVLLLKSRLEKASA